MAVSIWPDHEWVDPIAFSTKYGVLMSAPSATRAGPAAPGGAIAVVDLGGQYCHLISRRLREIGAESEIFPPTARAELLCEYAGVILSGGPHSVYDEDSFSIKGLLGIGVPILGICYGHQLLARELGARVAPGGEEYGISELTLKLADTLFADTPERQTVWMSHSDAVFDLPRQVTTLASTGRCAVAAFADLERKLFGVQFHPEVTHTRHGRKILENFVFSVCELSAGEAAEDLVDRLVREIRARVGRKSVFFLVSGGVDSTVAFALCAKALPPEQLLGLHIDTGLMRKGETDELRANLGPFGLAERLRIRDESARFLAALQDVIDPEEKRRIIGRLFVEIQSEALREYGIDGDHWLLGQGTIYPDTIESGGSSGSAALIKTHHNRCEEIRELLVAGRVIEPLDKFYKDEVRQIGAALGLDAKLTGRWPFPGPGLAIRCLCTREGADAEAHAATLAQTFRQYQAISLPLRTVGVQGDGRTYREVVAVRGPLDYPSLQRLTSALCNQGRTHNRVICHLAGTDDLERFRVLPGKSLTRERLGLLREADFIARRRMEEAGQTDAVWQFPVVLIPLSLGEGESVVLRPVDSEDGMTANFARLDSAILYGIAAEIAQLPGIDAVFLDISDKPPATIEWE
jgi:GMP synthase (glutamine-hydrolysing)